MGDMNFAIMVYSSDDSNNSVAANVIGKGSDTCYQSGAGEYYFTINTAQQYNITVEELK